MPINVNDQDYVKAEKDYYEADTLEEKLTALKKMISHMPGHKGAEKLRAQLRTRQKKLQEQIIKAKKSGKSSQKGIKKEGLQVVIIGKTNSGKSTLIESLTNTKPKIAEYNFTTKEPVIGMINYSGIQIQLIENPAIESEYYDKGLTNSADTLLILINDLKEIKKIQEEIKKAPGKKIIVLNDKKDLDKNSLRKIKATLASKKLNFIILNLKKKEGLEKLKEKIFQGFDKMRIYTKEPNKKEKSEKPIIMKKESTVKDVAEKILKGFSKNIKQTKIWGPSSKFPGQEVGLQHKLKDLDVVEFKTK